MTGFDSKRDMAADKLRDCMHGKLARSCQICDLEAEVEELKEALAQPAQEPWNAALDEAASRIGEIKGFGQATQDSFAVFIQGLRR